MTIPDQTHRGGGPEWQPQHRTAVERATNQLLQAMADLLMRRTGRDGLYAYPDPIQYGDVTGLMANVEHAILGPLRVRIMAVEEAMARVREAIDTDRLTRFGPAATRGGP